MGGDQYGDALALEFADHIEKLVSRLRIEPGGRLVQNGNLGMLHDELGKTEPLAHAARERRYGLVRHIGEPHACDRVGDARPAHIAAKSHQPGRVGEVFDRRHMVVKAHRVRKIADPALDFQGPAHRIMTRDRHGARRYVGEAQHHQNRGGLAGTVRPQEAEGLAFEDVEVERIDDDGLTVALGEASRGDGGLAHRRPNLATAPNISNSATAIMPNPTMPQVVEVATVTRNWVEAVSPREAARIVAI